MKETAPLQMTEHSELLQALEAALESLRALPPEQANGADAQARQLKLAFENAHYAASRLGELWMAARFDNGEFEPDNKPVSAKQLIQDALEPLAGKANDYGIELSLKVEGSPVIKGDPQLLKSLMANLLSSTISVSTKGTKILVSAFQRGKEIIVKIEDQGDGISARLFPNLVRSRSDIRSQRQSKGPVDVGTLMVKPIIDAHDGRLWVERQGESGSALFLAFAPIKVDQTKKDETQAKVLIVDDDPDGAFMLDQAITKGGFVTEVAYDGLSGLAKARSQNIGLVLLDVMLPGIDGFEVCNRLRSDPATKELPIVMISAKSRPEDRETGLRMGADDYLSKPLRLAEVLTKVQEYMSKP
jgi:CheY-like chemotaxis protein